VLREIESRQSATLPMHREYIAKLDAESAEFRRRTTQNLVEITDKLNRLIRYRDGMHGPPSP
jgi:hypothetical protein